MRSAAAAEFILSLAAPREQAVSITGDLLEQTRGRGCVWFWSSVLRTAVAWSVREFAASPRMHGSVAAKGFVFVFLWQLPLLFFAVILNLNLRPSERDAVFAWLVLGLLVLTQFMAGRAVAKRSPNREIPAWLAFALLETVVNTVAIVSQRPEWRAIPLAFACFALYQIPAFAGAALIRRRRFRYA
jgi:hypothetical protein